MTDNTNKLAILEALLFAADEPLNEKQVSGAADIILDVEVPDLIAELIESYKTGNRGITIQRAAGGWRLATAPQYAEYVRRHLRGRIRTKLSKAAVETISIIAYRQPASRAIVEKLRGIESSQVIRNLLERGLVCVLGREEAPGRPLLYGTTNQFLTYFGLDSLESLPKPEELLGPILEGDGESVQAGPFMVSASNNITEEDIKEDLGESESDNSDDEPLLNSETSSE